MKKLLLLSCLIFTVGCADTALLGYENTYYRPIQEKSVAVYYGVVPQNCQQIGMTILTASLFSGNLEKEINELREEAAKIGGNYVNINDYHYNAGAFNAKAYHMTGVIYRCQSSNSK